MGRSAGQVGLCPRASLPPPTHRAAYHKNLLKLSREAQSTFWTADSQYCHQESHLKISLDVKRKPPCWRGLALISPAGCCRPVMIETGACRIPARPPQPPAHYRGLGPQTLLEQVAGIARVSLPTHLPGAGDRFRRPAPYNHGSPARAGGQSLRAAVGARVLGWALLRPTRA